MKSVSRSDVIFKGPNRSRPPITYILGKIVKRINTMVVNGRAISVQLLTFFQISSFVFGRINKCIEVWNNLRVSKL